MKNLVLLLASLSVFALPGIGVKQSGQFPKIQDELGLKARQYKRLQDVSREELQSILQSNHQIKDCQLGYIEQNGQEALDFVMGMIDQNNPMFGSTENILGSVEEIDLSDLNLYGTGMTRFIDFDGENKIELEAPSGMVKVTLRDKGQSAKKRPIVVNGKQLIEYHIWQDVRQELYLSSDFWNALSDELKSYEGLNTGDIIPRAAGSLEAVEEDCADCQQQGNGFMRGLKKVGGFLGSKTVNGINRVTGLLSTSQRNRIKLYVDPYTNEIYEFDEDITLAISNGFARGTYNKIGNAFIPEGYELIEAEQMNSLADNFCSTLD